MHSKYILVMTKWKKKSNFKCECSSLLRKLVKRGKGSLRCSKSLSCHSKSSRGFVGFFLVYHQRMDEFQRSWALRSSRDAWDINVSVHWQRMIYCCLYPSRRSSVAMSTDPISLSKTPNGWIYTKHDTPLSSPLPPASPSTLHSHQ